MIKKVLCSLAIMALLLPSMASAIVLEATYDSWIRVEDIGFVFNQRDNDLVSVWDSTSRRYGTVEFDLSSVGVAITSAHLQLWDGDTGFSDADDAIDQNSTLVQGTWTAPANGGAAGVGLLDFAAVEAAIAAGTPMALGDINLSAHSATHSPEDFIITSVSGGADPDIIALNADLSGNSGDDLATFIFSTELGRHSWGDGFNSQVARLVINEAPFELPPPPFGIDAVVWARAGSAHFGDGLLVSDNPAVIGGAPTVGLVQWDLNHSDFNGIDSANLVGATIEFTVADQSRTQDPGQVAAQIDLNGTPLSGTATEPSYTAEYAGQENALTGLGVVPNLGAGLVNGDTVLTTASAADLDLIKAVLNGTKLLTLELRSDSNVTGQYWGGGGFGPDPILTLTFIPEPSTILLSLVGVFGLVLRRRRQ